MTSEVSEMHELRLKRGTKSDADAAARGDGAELPVPVRRSGTLDGLIDRFTDFKDAVARRPTMEELFPLVDGEGPVDSSRVVERNAKRALVSRMPTVVTRVRELAPHLQEKRQVELTHWEAFIEIVRTRPVWTDLFAGAVMMLFSIAVLAFALRKVGLL